LSNTEQHINALLKTALTKLAFLPFALALDTWRFELFRGHIRPENYNRRWWQLRWEARMFIFQLKCDWNAECKKAGAVSMGGKCRS